MTIDIRNTTPRENTTKDILAYKRYEEIIKQGISKRDKWVRSRIMRKLCVDTIKCDSDLFSKYSELLILFDNKYKSLKDTTYTQYLIQSFTKKIKL